MLSVRYLVLLLAFPPCIASTVTYKFNRRNVDSFVFAVETDRPVLNKDSIVLRCTISGFETNLPTMDYDWLFNGSLIPHPHDQLAGASAVHSPDALKANSKYNVSFQEGAITLTISNPGQLIFASFYTILGSCTAAAAASLRAMFLFRM